MSTSIHGRAALASGPGGYCTWTGGDTSGLEAFAGDRWAGPGPDGLPRVRGKDGKPVTVREGWTVFAQDGLGWLVVIAAEVWEAWACEAA